MTHVKRGLIIALLLCLFAPSALADSDLPYDTYTYDYWDDVRFTPAAYVPVSSVGGGDLTYEGEPIGAFSSPQDICRSPGGAFYLADTGNNRIVVLNETLDAVENVIDGFALDGARQTFDAPTGVAVSLTGEIYIADSQNRRIVALYPDGTLFKIVENPESEVLEAGYVFTPLKVCVDYADRIYCIAQKMFEGIMVFDTDGRFTGFYGTIEVKISLWEKFWRRVATKEERSRQKLFIPTEFTGIDIDDDGFVYASNIDTDGAQAVKRLNPRGEDVIRKGFKENLGGDLWIGGYSQYAGPSKMADVVYRGSGIYSLLDSRRGRVFTYDHEGNLLYIFGGLGTQRGTFTTPAAIEAVGDTILVLDSYRAAILVFGETEYGALINEAVALRYDGDETLAVAKWEAVLRLDENNELANVGIGKAYLAAGDNERAMRYLKRGMNKSYYSVAYKRYRNAILRDNLGLILTAVIALLIGAVVLFRLRRRRRIRRSEIRLTARARGEPDGAVTARRRRRPAPPVGSAHARRGWARHFGRDKWQTLLYTVGHPADGYYWIRHQDTGSVGIAVVLVILFSLSFSANRMYASFIVNTVNPRSVSSLQELGGVLLLYLMVCVGNWSVTCLMDGEGRFKDILIAVGYAMLPLIVTFNLATLVSQIVAENEEGFYTILLIVGIAYTAMMALTGVMQVHNYTLGKTLLTLFLTLVAVFIIIFLCLLVFNFIGQIVTFFQSIYYELLFRT